MTPEQAAEDFLEYLQEGLSGLGRQVSRTQFNDLIKQRLLEIIQAQRAEAVAEAQKWQTVKLPEKQSTVRIAYEATNLYGERYRASEDCYFDEWLDDTLKVFFQGKKDPVYLGWQPLPAPPAQEGEG